MDQQVPQHDPKPPELIENLRWLRHHGLQHWPYVLVALCIGSVVFAIKLGLLDKTSQTQQVLEKTNGLTTEVAKQNRPTETLRFS